MQRTSAPTPPQPLAPPPARVEAPKRGFAFSPIAWMVATGALLGALFAQGAGRLLLANQIGMRQATADVLGALLGVLVAGVGGWAVAAISKRVGFWEIVGGFLVLVGAGYLLLGFGGHLGASFFDWVPEGGIWFSPLLVGLASFLVAAIASTVGYMFGAGHRLDLSFGWEAKVAKSHLRLSRQLLIGLGLLTFGIVPGIVALSLLLRRQKRSPTLIMTVLSIGGVAVGVMALCVVLSVMSGFEIDLKRKILGTNAHAVVLKYGTFDGWEKAAETARETPGVRGVTPFVLQEVMVTAENNLTGALVKGIDPETVGDVTELPREIVEGKLEYLADPSAIPLARTGLRRGSKELDAIADAFDEAVRAPRGGGTVAPPTPTPSPGAGAADEAEEVNRLPGIVLGRELARQLRVFVGDPVTVVSPLGGELGPMGPQPKSMQFRVAAVFYSGMYEYDSKFVYIALDRAQAFFKMGRAVSGLELKVADIDDARRISRNVLGNLEGYPFRVKDWGEMNRNLFSALKLEKIVMAVILAFIILVACFNILSTLVMLVLEKGKEISILKSMGARDNQVMKVFVLEGLAIGGIGTAVGLSLGLLLCGMISVFPIPLDPEVYYISSVPVKLDGMQFLLVGVAAVVLAYLATIFPALYASRLRPVEGLRND